MRSSQSKEKTNWIRPTQKPESRTYGGEKEARYVDKGYYATGYYRKKWIMIAYACFYYYYLFPFIRWPIEKQIEN